MVRSKVSALVRMGGCGARVGLMMDTGGLLLARNSVLPFVGNGEARFEGVAQLIDSLNVGMGMESPIGILPKCSLTRGACFTVLGMRCSKHGQCL